MRYLNRLFCEIRKLSVQSADLRIPTYAASIAFFQFLSLFPLSILAVSLLPRVGLSETALLHFLVDIVPVGVYELLRDILLQVYRHEQTALPVSLLVLLWSSAQAMSELIKGLLAVTAPSRRISFFKRRTRAIVLTIALLFSLLLSLVVLVWGQRVLLLFISLFPKESKTLLLLLRLRYLVIALFLWLLLVLLYRAIPGMKFSFREVRLGASLAAIAWLAFSGLFSLYVTRLLDLSLYGSMATMVLTMLWLLYCQHIALLGALVCAKLRIKKAATDRQPSGG